MRCASSVELRLRAELLSRHINAGRGARRRLLPAPCEDARRRRHAVGEAAAPAVSIQEAWRRGGAPCLFIACLLPRTLGLLGTLGMLLRALWTVYYGAARFDGFFLPRWCTGHAVMAYVFLGAARARYLACRDTLAVRDFATKRRRRSWTALYVTCDIV